MTTDLGMIYHNQYGNMETEVTDVEFVEIKTYSKEHGRHIYAIYYGPKLYRKINTETMTNPVAYIAALKNQGWKKLKAKKVFIGHKEISFDEKINKNKDEYYLAKVKNEELKNRISERDDIFSYKIEKSSIFKKIKNIFKRV